MNIVVESAVELTEKQVDALEKNFSNNLAKGYSVSYRVDSTLIGGLRIVTPKKTIDMSLAAKLTQLSQALQTK